MEVIHFYEELIKKTHVYSLGLIGIGLIGTGLIGMGLKSVTKFQIKSVIQMFKHFIYQHLLKYTVRNVISISNSFYYNFRNYLLRFKDRN